jgi:AraC family transcriptional regulator of adaptative response / DNA-3-methyladenine glycosylase II
LDLDCDPEPIIDALGADPLLGRSVGAVPGRRVPGHVDPHELAVRAVLGQQISLPAAATLAGRLTRRYGEPLGWQAGELTHTFPSAAALAAARPEELGMPASRARALLALTRALATGALVLDTGVDREETRARLLKLPGIGAWTAEYIAMRGLRDPDAFLASDLGIRRALERLGQDVSPTAAARLAERWRPYRAYAAQHLWAIAAGPRTSAAGPATPPLHDPLRSRLS